MMNFQEILCMWQVEIFHKMQTISPEQRKKQLAEDWDQLKLMAP